MEFEKNTMLFGADRTPRIVAIELGETGTVKVYRRGKGGLTVVEVEPFHPFVWCDSDVLDLGIESEKLESSLKYGWQVTVDSWKELIALRNGLRNAGRDFFAFTDPVQHYLTATGRTLFKDLRFEELKRMQIAEKTIDYPKFTVGGRHFVDTFLLAQFYDVGMRSLAGFERTDVARHFELCDGEQISALTGKELQRAYLESSEAFRRRALCGVRETRALSELLSASYFIQAQIFPYNYQDVIVRGNATRINALFLREYFRQRHSIPELPMVRGFEGGYTDIFFTGVARNVWHCDVASLYPSVMLQFACFPQTDQLQIFRHLLTDLRTFRLEAKADMRAAEKSGDTVRAHHFHAFQNTFKILLNSFYGYLGFAQGSFADFDAAARVTQIGRDLLKKMIECLNAGDVRVIEVDTDGIDFTAPPCIVI